MDMENMKQRAWRAWAIAGLLAVLCAVLAVLQSRWISEVSMAERARLRVQLQTGLNQLSTDFNDRVAEACGGLMPDSTQFDQSVREATYAGQYRLWKESHEPLLESLAYFTSPLSLAGALLSSAYEIPLQPISAAPKHAQPINFRTAPASVIFDVTSCHNHPSNEMHAAFARKLNRRFNRYNRTNRTLAVSPA